MSSKTEEPIIEISQVSHTYGSVLVLENINLKVMRGEFIAIVGPSGCGKTTLLNIISGFENPDEGSVCRRGKLSMIYQKDGLFPRSEERRVGKEGRLRRWASRQKKIGRRRG